MRGRGKGSGQVPFMLAEQRRGWSLMIFYARATRGLRRTERGAARPSFLLAERARSEGARPMRAVKDSLAAPLKAKWGKLEGPCLVGH